MNSEKESPRFLGEWTMRVDTTNATLLAVFAVMAVMLFLVLMVYAAIVIDRTIDTVVTVRAERLVGTADRPQQVGEVEGKIDRIGGQLDRLSTIIFRIMNKGEQGDGNAAGPEALRDELERLGRTPPTQAK